MYSDFYLTRAVSKHRRDTSPVWGTDLFPYFWIHPLKPPKGGLKRFFLFLNPPPGDALSSVEVGLGGFSHEERGKIEEPVTGVTSRGLLNL